MNYYIGVDGGGTKTKLILINENLDLQALNELEASNLITTNPSDTINKINRIISNYLNTYNIQGIGLGMAGIDTEADRVRLEQRISREYPGKKVKVFNDGVTSLIGGLNNQPGILINAGTGSISVGIDDDGNINRAGGWDYLLGDEGSGYWIGKKLIQTAIHDYDCGIHTSEVIKTVKGFFQLKKLEGLIEIVYKKKLNKELIAKLALEAVGLAESGDVQAKRIFEKAGVELAKLVIRVYERGNFKTPVSLTYNGSIFNSFNLFEDSFYMLLNKNQLIYKWQEPQYPAEIGAALMVMKSRNHGENIYEIKI